MTTKKVSTKKPGRDNPEPEKSMTKDEAIVLASGIGAALENHMDGTLGTFILLLRWFAYKADDTDREETYTWTEAEYNRCFDGVEEAVRRELQRTLDALRKRRAR
jgi:hypothetical protein